ncbi:MAG: FIST C-terminal domain-containing protein [Kofleriaceae bacterium]|jgi:hypothetical protein|nr:FIST C-terminal domain-containing protein [Kofleriaceae bacterium]MBP6837627.1 FIST C-terminal domain-containing protein [Kofleriaceae bacterium]MBP9204412.1 FIST C-terminal domain-containing protein [Kofleriaceae bacterium]
MHSQSYSYDLDRRTWSAAPDGGLDSPRTLVLAFGTADVANHARIIEDLSKTFPKALVVGCSTAGEIHDTAVRDRSVAVAVTRFDQTDIALASLEVRAAADSFTAGQQLAKRLSIKAGLRGVLVLSEGLGINGADLVRGLSAVLPDNVVVTGGLAGDGTNFKRTWVAVAGKVKPNLVAAIGFYGDHIVIGHGAQGGWDKLGPERTITRAEGNVLYELDGRPALAVYAEYLGERARDLPSAGVAFPIAVRASATDERATVRLVLAVDPQAQSITFAGDVPAGGRCQLLKADPDHLVDAATAVVGAATTTQPAGDTSLTIAVSCIGRRLVLGDRVGEELEGVRAALPAAGAQLIGFYAYSQISPAPTGHPALHNETLTVTVLSESATPLPRPRSRTTPPPRTSPGATGPVPTRPAPTPTGPVPALRATVHGTAPAPAPAPTTAPASPTTPRPGVAPTQAQALAQAQAQAAAQNRPGRVMTTTLPAVARQAKPATRPPPAPGAAAPGAAPATTGAGLAIADVSYDIGSRSWSGPFPPLDSPRTLVLAFGAPEFAEDPAAFEQLGQAFPNSLVVGCSTAGEVRGAEVRDHSLAVSVARFDQTDIALASLEVRSAADSFTAGQQLAKRLSIKAGLRGVLVLSEGLNVSGTELLRGFNAVLADSVVVTGGLAGDGANFRRTWVAVGSKLKPNLVAAVGFYGDHVVLGHGSKGGWDKFGPERTVTRAEGNVLYELDGKPALALYAEYLGDRARDLPSVGLLFPLALRASASDDKVVIRTVLAVDARAQSLTFAGEIPSGWRAQLMKADYDRLIDSGGLAAAAAMSTGKPVGQACLALAVSCIGRRLVLGDRTSEELEAVRAGISAKTVHLTGFYAYSQISPFAIGHSDLHNQTMTVTLISESPTPLPRAASSSGGIAAGTGPRAAAPSGRVVATGTDPGRGTGRLPAVDASAPFTRLSTVDMTNPIKAAAQPPPARELTGPLLRAQQPPGPAEATIEKISHGDVTVVRIAGRLTEAFKGDALGRTLRGRVLFDLGAVDRVTSFGVREWLSMFAAANRDVTECYLGRCSESVVNQLGMIRKFDGGARIISFFAPYLCDACGHNFERLFDCEFEAEVIEGGARDTVKCPSCSEPARFDDDARTYLGFATAHLRQPVPADLRALHDSLANAAAPTRRDEIDKVVEGDSTRVRIQTRLTPQLRWRRILDGIEGRLILDFANSTGVDAAGVSALEDALRALPGEVSEASVEGATFALASQLRLASPKIRITSVTLEGRCGTCGVHRVATVRVPDLAADRAAGRAHVVRCKRCNGELEIAIPPGIEILARRVGSPTLPPPMLGPVDEASAPVPLPSMLAPTVPATVATAVAPARRGPGLATFVLAVGLAGAIGALIMVLASGRRDGATPAAVLAPAAGSGSAAPEAEAEPTWTGGGELPPGWVDRALVVEADAVYAVGRSVVAPSAEAAIEGARLDASLRLLDRVQQDLVGSTIGKFLDARAASMPPAGPGAAARFARQQPAIAGIERVDTSTRKSADGIEVYARFKLTRAAYDDVVKSYRATGRFRGMTFGLLFPRLDATIPTKGDLIVLAVEPRTAAAQAAVRPGDVVLKVAGKPHPGAKAFESAALQAWVDTPYDQRVIVELESAGASRNVGFLRPDPR